MHRCVCRAKVTLASVTVLWVLTILLALAPRASLAVSLSGRVVDGEGQGLAAATVVWSDLVGDAAVATASTAADGRFELDDLPVGMGRVEIRVAGRIAAQHEVTPLVTDTRLPTVRLLDGESPTSWPLGATRDWQVPEAPIRTHDERPRRRDSLLEGRLLDHDGRPLAGGFVWIDGRPEGFVRTDAAGRYRLSVRTQPGALLRATAPGHVAVRHPLSPIGRGIRGPTLALTQASRRVGRVVESRGRVGIADAIVVAEIADPRARSGARRVATVTDPDGAFILEPMAPNTAYRLRVIGHGTIVSTVEMPVDQGLRPLEIALSSGRAVWGTVVGPADRPVAEAIVRLFSNDPSGREAPSEGFGDQAGHVELSAVAEGRYDLEVAARGFAPTRVRGVDIPTGDEPFDLGIITLLPGVEVSGRVVDPAGRPLAGARVEVTTAGGSAGVGAVATEVRTDEGGDFTIPDRRPGATLHLDVRLDGYDRTTASVRLPTEPSASGRRPVLVELAPATRVAGRVLDPQGDAAIGAAVHVETAEGGGWRTITTDARGRFRIDQLPAGRSRLHAMRDGAGRSPSVSIELGAGESIEVELRLQPEATLTGWVLDGDGTPLVGAAIRVGEVADGKEPLGPRWHTSSDGDGQYVLTGLREGIILVEVGHVDFPPWRQKLAIDVGANHRDLTLPRGQAIGGRVVDDSGDVVVGARVSLSPTGSPDGDARRSVRTTFSDRDGAFLFSNVGRGDVTLRAEAKGFAPSAASTITIDGRPTRGIELRVARGGRLVGRILGLDFDTLNGVLIEARQPGRPTVVGQVDYRGEYRIEPLSAGRWQIRARTTSGARQAVERIDLDGTSEAALDLEFGAGVRLDGEVSRDGRALAGARLLLLADPAGQWSGSLPPSVAVTTELDGRFRFEDVEPGRYRLETRGPDGRSRDVRRLDVVVDETVHVDLAGGRWGGRVTDAASGLPVGDVRLRLQPLDEGATTVAPLATSTERGAFRFDGVDHGRYRLSARHDGYETFEDVVELAPGSVDQSLDVTLSPADGLQLVVRDSGGGTPDRVTVAVLDARGQVTTAGRWWTDGEGRVEVPGLSAGRWRTMVRAPGSATVARTVEKPGESIQVDLPAASTLRVRVPELAEESSATAWASLTDSRSSSPFVELTVGGALRRAWRLDAGETVITGLAPGLWRLVVRSADGRIWRRLVSVTPGSRAEATLDAPSIDTAAP